MELMVQIKNVYGTEKIYPVCTQAKNLADLLGTVTITREAIHKAKKLGFTFTVKTKQQSI